MSASLNHETLKTKFDSKFRKLLTSKRTDNSFYLSDEQYDNVIQEVRSAKLAAKRSTLQYRRLKRFDVCTIGGVEKLIAPVAGQGNSILYYVKNSDLFDVLHTIHIDTGHGGRNRMINE